MKWQFDWQDFRLFLAVARGGGLVKAAAETGLSPPTLGRRMTAIERDLEERLFNRGGRGYSLTEAGLALFEYALAMEAVASDVARWRDGHSPARRVRISAGIWTTQFLADNIASYWSPSDAWVPELLADNAKRDIGRREADIGLRSAPPDAPSLAGRRAGMSTYAVYQASQPVESMSGCTGRWIGISGDAVFTPSARWTAEQHGDDVTITVNDPHLGLPMVRQGLGRMVLPCFVGDAFSDLRKVEVIDELTHGIWLVMHETDRNHPPVRSAIDALARFLATPDQTLRP